MNPVVFARHFASVAVLLSALAINAPAHAQADMRHGDMHMSMQPPASASASTQAYQAGMQRMHKDMDMAYTGNADVDFARGMIPHHQGAIDMAKTELQYGKDPELRKLAQEVLESQAKEVTFLQAWLEKNVKTK
jgi:uncharacterized protein (DUF305 family)